MQLKRLHPDDLESWPLYPLFENRVIALQEKTGPPINLQAFRAELRKRWVCEPMLAGYWVFIEGGKVIGHQCSWFVLQWATPSIFAYQLERDDGYHLGELGKELWRQIGAWARLFGPNVNCTGCVMDPDFIPDYLRKQGCDITLGERIVRIGFPNGHTDSPAV
jgi:hypothetical protein